MTSKKAKEKLVQEQLDRILEILTGHEYNGPMEKIGAIRACSDIGEEIIYGDVPGESHGTKD
jgi:Ni,Fe-hydrogenase III large subunit